MLVLVMSQQPSAKRRWINTVEMAQPSWSGWTNKARIAKERVIRSCWMIFDCNYQIPHVGSLLLYQWEWIKYPVNFELLPEPRIWVRSTDVLLRTVGQSVIVMLQNSALQLTNGLHGRTMQKGRSSSLILEMKCPRCVIFLLSTTYLVKITLQNEKNS